MRKTDVLAHYGNNQSAVARALKITRASVNAWPELVPEASAYRVERDAEGCSCAVCAAGKLKVNPVVYDRLRRKRAALRAPAGV